MKYNIRWQEEVKTLPYNLQNKCINYKQLKKIKNVDASILQTLESTCNHIDKIFDNDKIDKDALYKFAKINKETLYKLSKRLGKRYDQHIFEWYLNNNKKYHFCGGCRFKKLELETKGYDDECPICLDKRDEYIITDCGHIICIECFKRLYNVDKLTGTLDNLVSYSVYNNHFIPKCPLCRGLMPMHLNKNQIFKCTRDCKCENSICNKLMSCFKM
jgi:hypothetical protein